MAPTRRSADERLVRLAQSGVPGAFDELIERHAGLVYHIARARLREHESAEDLVQEVFLRVHLNLRRLNDPSRLAPWLARLTRNLATDWQRRGQRRSQLVPMVPLDEEVSQVPDTQSPGARERLEAEERRQALHDALDRLPVEQRELVLLHYGEEIEQREIAARLGVHPSSVSRQLKRALKSLRGLAEVTLREAAPSLRMPSTVVSRTSVLIAAAAAMSTTAKASLAVQTAATPITTGTVAKAGLVGLLQTILAKFVAAGSGSVSLAQSGAAKIAAGGALMAAHKGLAAAAAFVVVASGATYYHMRSGEPPDLSDAVVTETFTAVEETAPDTAGAQLDSIRLSSGYRAGQTYTARLQVDIVQDMQVHAGPGGPEEPIHQEVGITFDANGRVVEELPDGSARMEESITDFQLGRFEVLVGGRPAPGQDGERGRQLATELMTKMFSGMGFEKTVDRLGNVTSLELGGADQEYQEYFDQSAFIRDIITVVMSGYPDRPLRVGDTWTREFEIPGVPGIHARATSKLESIRDDNGRPVAVITRVVNLDIGHPFPIKLPPEQGIPPNAQVQVDGLRGWITSEEHVLVDGMLPIRSIGTTDLRIPIRVSGMPDQPAGQEVTIDTRQRQRFTADMEYTS